MSKPLSVALITFFLFIVNGYAQNHTDSPFIDSTKTHYFIPNSFSPNGDFKNDLLFIYAPHLREIEWSIYDSRGKMIFYTTEISQSWNGTYNGEVMNEENYFYTLKAKTKEGKAILGKGSIAIIQ